MVKLRRLKDFPGYAVSRDGRVWGCKGTHNDIVPWRELRLRVDPYGYPLIGLWRDKKQVMKKVHRLVWDAYNGCLPVGMTVNHKDGDKTNNAIENLEVLSQSDNMKHAWKTGLMKNRAVGERVNKGKFTSAQVLEIRKLYATGNYSMPALARQFDTWSSSICDIVNRKTWKHI